MVNNLGSKGGPYPDFHGYPLGNDHIFRIDFEKEIKPACLSQCLVGYVSSLEGNIDIKKAGFAYDAWKEQIHSP